MGDGIEMRGEGSAARRKDDDRKGSLRVERMIKRAEQESGINR